MPDEQDYDLQPINYAPVFADAPEPTPADRLPSRFGAPQPELGKKIVSGMAKGFAHQVMAPGIAAQPIQPETPGMWSDVDEARRIATENAAVDWAPATALNMIRTGTQMTPEGAVGTGGTNVPIRAYHGSPHDFDRFDFSKIGTGEGAQVYGHGGYFAGAEPTAMTYRQASHTIEGKPLDKFLSETPKIDTVYDALRELKAQGKSPTIEDAAKYFQQSPIPHERTVAEALQTYGSVDNARRMMNKEALPTLDKMIESGRLQSSPGHMYAVDIYANPEHFLDWDKPLSEQHPKVQGILKEHFGLGNLPPDRTSLFHDVQRSVANRDPEGIKGSWYSYAPKTTEALRDAGIPGIKYLDQGSRTPDPAYILRNIEQAKSKIAEYEGKGYPEDLITSHREMLARQQELLEQARTMNRTSNYVVFDDKLIDVIKKYGLAGLVAGGAGHFATKAVDYDPFKDDAQRPSVTVPRRAEHAKGGAVKLSHASVGYVAQSTHLPQKCGGCTMFLPSSGCTLVQSPIKAGGWCRRFQKGKNK